MPRHWTRTLLYDVALCLVAGAAFAGIVAPPALEPFLRSFFFNSILILCGGLTVASLVRAVDARLPPTSTTWTRLAAYAGSVVCGVAAGEELAIRLIHAFGGPAPTETRAEALRIGLVLATVGTVLCVLYNRLRRQARDTESRAQRIEQRAVEAELEALQARTNPHFIFNSLNTVAGLISERPAAAERMVERLAGLFRYSLARSTTQWVRLDEELKTTRDYLEVEAVRFEDRLRIDLDVEHGSETLMVPPFILQPIVENAVVHGIANRLNGGRIAVKVRRETSRLVIGVVNDAPDAEQIASGGTGSALTTLRNRLTLIYGSEATLETGAGDGDYHVTLSLPIAIGGNRP